MAVVLAVLLLAVMAVGAFSLASETSGAGNSNTQIDLNATLGGQNYTYWESNAAGTEFKIKAGGTVTVVGTVANAAAIKFDIASGATARWTADYSGSTTLLTITGNGTFEVISGEVSSTLGIAIYSDGASPTIKISGGTVFAAANNAIRASGDDASIVVTGGTVSGTGTGSSTIYTDGASPTITVSGGTVSGTNNRAISAAGASSTITVSGGTVFTTSLNSNVIRVDGTNASVTVTGGTVYNKATLTYAINAPGTNSTVAVSGGFVFSHGTGKTDVINGGGFTAPTGNGIVAAWNPSSGSTTIEGSTTGLFFLPNTAAVTWHNDSALGGGISYELNANEGFFPIAGVTVDTATYTVTVNGGTVSPASAAAGSTVNITANPAPEGKQFDQWEISPTVTFTGGTSSTDAAAKFIMPGTPVTAAAVYKDVPAEPGGEGDDEGGGGSNTLLYVAIIVIVVLLVLAVVYFLFFKGKIGKP